jgi:hypothetical protein
MDPTRPTASTARVKEPMPVDRASFSTGPQVMKTGYTDESSTQEDWLSLATADPAFWLKGVNR